MTVLAYLKDKENRYIFSDSRIMYDSDHIAESQKIFKIDDLIIGTCGSVMLAEQLVACLVCLNDRNSLNNLTYLFGQFLNDYKNYLGERGIEDKNQIGSSSELLVLTQDITFTFTVGGGEDIYHEVLTDDEFIGSGARETEAAYRALVPYIKDVTKRFTQALNVASSINNTIDHKVQRKIVKITR